MRRVLWTEVLLAVAAVASGANCLEAAQEIGEEAAAEVAQLQTVGAAEVAIGREYSVLTGMRRCVS